jgi:hypothetical protein
MGHTYYLVLRISSCRPPTSAASLRLAVGRAAPVASFLHSLFSILSPPSPKRFPRIPLLLYSRKSFFLLHRYNRTFIFCILNTRKSWSQNFFARVPCKKSLSRCAAVKVVTRSPFSLLIPLLYSSPTTCQARLGRQNSWIETNAF